jgi:transposase
LIPVTGERKSVKIFAAVEVYTAQFVYRRDRVFNGQTYLDFLDRSLAPQYYRRGQRVIYIQDNASYHKEAEVWEWFAANRDWLEVCQLPPYSPELNASEPLWHHTRVHATHNRSFKSEEEIMESLGKTFRSMRRYPQQIMGYLQPFQ